MKQYNLNGLSGNGILITNNHKESLIYFGSIFKEEKNILFDFFRNLKGGIVMTETEIKPETFLDLSFKRFEISTGEPGPSTEIVERRRKELAEIRRAKFDAAATAIENKFGKEACQLILTKWQNGSRLAIMEVVAGLENIKKEDLLFALKKSLGESPDFLSTMIGLIADWPDQGTIASAAQKAHAWKYLRYLGLGKYLPREANLLGEVLRAFRAYGEIDPAELPKKKGKFSKKVEAGLKKHFNCTSR